MVVHWRTSAFLKTQERMARKGTPRWRNADGSRLWEWDQVHAHVEGYNARGQHVGVFDSQSGERIAAAVRGRRVDV